MSTGQLSLLKKLADDQEFGAEVSVDSDEVQFRNPKESDDGTTTCPSSLEKEEDKSYTYDEEEEEDEYRDEDSEEDESSYESETSDETEDVDSSSSELPQSSLEVSLIKEAAEKSFRLEKDEEIESQEGEEEESKNLESSNKNTKSVSFDGISKSKELVSTEGSSSTVLTRGTIPDILTDRNDSSLGRKKMMRQEHINLGGSEENTGSVSMNKANSTSSINATDSAPTSKAPSSGHSRRNPSMRIPCQKTSSILDNSSRLSSIKERRQKKRNGWTPVSVDERLDLNYLELYQLMTRDIEVKGEARQLVHAYQMEQLYERYVSVSHGKIPPYTLYPHNWPQCVIRRIFCPTLTTLHSALTNYSNATSFMKPTYMLPRSALSVRNDSSLEKVKTVKGSKRSRSPSKSNNRSSQQSGKNSRQTLNDSSSARFVDHRHGQSSNPDILKWLHGKNHMLLKQKREEKVQKQLQKETNRQETLMRAERRLQSQQAVYHWMQQKLKEYQQGSSEEKSFAEKKSEMNKTTESENLWRRTEDKIQSKNREQSCTQALPNNPPKVKGHLKPLQCQIKKNKENKLSVKSQHFKHMESTLSYDAWTRQTVNEGCTKVSNNCTDSKGSSNGSQKSKKKMLKDQESSYFTVDRKYSGKENENIGCLQENRTDLKTKEEEPFTQQRTIRPKTAHGTRVRHSADLNVDAVSENFEKVRSHSEKKEDETSLSGSTSGLNENGSQKVSDLDRNYSDNEKNNILEIMDDKKNHKGIFDDTEI